jgi:hypothetical protein
VYAVASFNKTTTVLRTYTVRYKVSICNNRGKKRKKLRKKIKDPLSFEIWIFRYGQPDRYHDGRMLVAMTSADEKRSLVSVAFAPVTELCPENDYWTQAV